MEAAKKQTQTDFSKITKLLRAAKGEGETASDEAVKCLQENRKVPSDIMEQLGPGKRVFLEHWNRLVKKLREVTERGPEREGGTA
jgi:hypothetical protein